MFRDPHSGLSVTFERLVGRSKEHGSNQVKAWVIPEWLEVMSVERNRRVKKRGDQLGKDQNTDRREKEAVRDLAFEVKDFLDSLADNRSSVLGDEDEGEFTDVKRVRAALTKVHKLFKL